MEYPQVSVETTEIEEVGSANSKEAGTSPMNSLDNVFVSVVIPVGSVGPDMREAYEAVTSQRAPFVYDVVLSLNTPDPAAAVALEDLIESSSKGIATKVVHSFEQAGAAYARNAGAKATSAEILVFCDADDVVEEQWLALLVRGLEGHDAVSGFVSDDKFMPDEQRDWRPPSNPDGGLPTFMGHPYLLTGNLAIKRAAFEAVGGFNTTLTRCEDIAVSWDLVEAGYSIGFVPDAVLHYRHRAGLWPMMRQHFYYGRGMSEVLMRIGPPSSSTQPRARNLLKPNGERVAKANVPSTLRRASIAAGRLYGIIEVKLRG